MEYLKESVIVNGSDKGRVARIEGNTILIKKGTHRLSKDKITHYKSDATAKRRFVSLTSEPMPTPKSETIILKRSDIMEEIERCKSITSNDPEDQYNKGRYNVLTAIIWAADIKGV